MPNSLRARLKNLVHKGVLSQKDLDRIVIVPVDGTGDLISRQAAKRIIYDEFEGWPTEEEIVQMKRLIKNLDELPSVSVAEKTGRWVDGTDCSCCGFAFYDDVIDSKLLVGFKYCPNCGAKMEVKE